MAEYQDEIVSRAAPRWAWDIIDETLCQVTQPFDRFSGERRDKIDRAFDAMVGACEKGE